MAALFYSAKEAAEKLNTTEDELRNIAEGGKLHEYRHGSMMLFKRDEVDALTRREDEGCVEKASLTRTAGRATLLPLKPDRARHFVDVKETSAQGIESVQDDDENVVEADYSFGEMAGDAGSVEWDRVSQEAALGADVTMRRADQPSQTAEPAQMRRVPQRKSALSGWQWFTSGLIYDQPGPVLLLFLALCDVLWRSAAVIYLVCRFA